MRRRRRTQQHKKRKGKKRSNSSMTASSSSSTPEPDDATPVHHAFEPVLTADQIALKERIEQNLQGDFLWDLSAFACGVYGVRRVVRALLEGSTVARVDLSRNALGTEGVVILCSGLAKLEASHRLCHLNLSWNRIGDGGVRALCSWLSSNNSLASLVLAGNRLTSRSATALADTLRYHNVTLEALDVSRNPFGEAAGEILGLMLTHSHSLRTLDASHCDLAASGSANLCRAMASASCSLVRLRLSGNGLTGDAGAALSAVLERNTTLTDLILSANALGVAGLDYLGTGLRVNKTLKSLDLSFNRLGSDCATQLHNLVAANSSVTALDLRGNELGYSAGVALFDAVRQSRSIRSLNVHHNDFGPNVAKALCRMVRESETLEVLQLAGYDIGPIGAELVRALSFSSTLIECDYTHHADAKTIATARDEILERNQRKNSSSPLRGTTV